MYEVNVKWYLKIKPAENIVNIVRLTENTIVKKNRNKNKKLLKYLNIGFFKCKTSR